MYELAQKKVVQKKVWRQKTTEVAGPKEWDSDQAAAPVSNLNISANIAVSNPTMQPLTGEITQVIKGEDAYTE